MRSEVSIEKTSWGEWKVLPNSFTIMSVEIVNRGAQPFDGDLVLRDLSSGAPVKQAVFLARHVALGAVPPVRRRLRAGVEALLE